MSFLDRIFSFFSNIRERFRDEDEELEEPGPETGPESEPGPDTGPDTGPEPGPETGPEPGPVPDTGPEPGPETGPEPGPEPYFEQPTFEDNIIPESYYNEENIITSGDIDDFEIIIPTDVDDDFEIIIPTDVDDDFEIIIPTDVEKESLYTEEEQEGFESLLNEATETDSDPFGLNSDLQDLLKDDSPPQIEDNVDFEEFARTVMDALPDISFHELAILSDEEIDVLSEILVEAQGEIYAPEVNRGDFTNLEDIFNVFDIDTLRSFTIMPITDNYGNLLGFRVIDSPSGTP